MGYSYNCLDFFSTILNHSVILEKYFPNMDIKEIKFNLKYNNDYKFVNKYNIMIEKYPHVKSVFEASSFIIDCV